MSCVKQFVTLEAAKKFLDSLNYEYLVADSAENAATIFQWIKEGVAEHCDLYGWTTAHNISVGEEYRKVNTTKLPEDLTDPEEISRGIEAGVVEFGCENAWAPARSVIIPIIDRFLERKYRFRVKPGCTIPPKEKLLTDPDEISRGVKAKVVEFWNEERWAPARSPNVYVIRHCLHTGSKFRVKPGCTLPPKEELLTDPEEISWGVTLGVVEFRVDPDSRWEDLKNSDIKFIMDASIRGLQFRYRPGKIITDPLDVYKGIQAGKVLERESETSPWRGPLLSSVVDIKRRMNKGHSFCLRQ
jgi:hypothetical protein